MTPADLNQFRRLAERGNVIALTRRLMSDQLTPVLGYRRLVAPDERTAPSFLFESVDTSGRAIGCLNKPNLLPQSDLRSLMGRWRRYSRIEVDRARRVPRAERWRQYASGHVRLARYLAWRYTKVLRSRALPRMPVHYEVARVVDHLMTAAHLMLARKRDGPPV